MGNTLTFFPVGNGDMSLIKLGDDFTLLIDCNLKDEATDSCPVVMVDDLYDMLPEDDDGRAYVDAFMLTHPDQDHCLGAEKYLHLDNPDDFDDDPGEDERNKIFVRELWSSPLVFRRLEKLRKDNKEEELCEDAKAIWAEARRRVAAYKESGAESNSDMDLGDRILILGDDLKSDDGADRLDGLEGIHFARDEVIAISNDVGELLFEGAVRAPLTAEDDEDEELLTKNNSSIVMQIKVYPDGEEAPNWLLFGGDAGVEVWKRLHDAYEDDLSDRLGYELLLAPHHCSWSVFAVSSDKDADEKARAALSQTRGNAKIVSSSKPIEDNEDNPPSYKAKMEYLSIIGRVESRFRCTGSYKNEDEPEPLTYELTKKGGPTEDEKKTHTSDLAAAGIVSLTGKERPHG